MTLISVIIPAYEHATMVLRALSSLQAKQALGPLEYIVSDDSSPVPMQAFIPPVMARCVRTPENRGFAGNCNYGASHSRGDILFFVNQDCYDAGHLAQGWNEALLSAFDDPAVAIVGARLLTPAGQVQSVGGAFDAAGQPFHPCLGWSNPDHWMIREPHKRTWVTGAAFAVRRWFFEQAGGFDTIYGRGYFEDADLCQKARQAGLTVMYTPGVTLAHEVGSTGGSPGFAANAQTFKARWVDTGIVRPEVPFVAVRYWA